MVELVEKICRNCEHWRHIGNSKRRPRYMDGEYRGKCRKGHACQLNGTILYYKTCKQFEEAQE